MSHTSTYEVDGLGPVRVIHNGDWSGDAKVTWTEGGVDRSARIPGRLLTALSRSVAVDFVRSEVIGILEQLEVHEFPDGKADGHESADPVG